MSITSLGKIAPGAATYTTLYTVPAGKTAVVSINACNTGSVEAYIRLAAGTTETPVTADFIEYDTIVLVGDAYERTGLALGAGEKVVVYADTAAVAFKIYGIEE